MTWDSKTTETLRSMWLAGASAGVIGGELGITRDAVLGRVRRLRINRAGTAPTKVVACRTRPIPAPVRIFARIPTEGPIWGKDESKRREAFARRASNAAREAREAAGL